MAFSYSSSLTSDKDKVRLLIGDNYQDDINSNYLLEDEEIQGWLNRYNSIDQAAAYCLRSISTNMDNLVILRDRAAGEITISELINELESKATNLLSK